VQVGIFPMGGKYGAAQLDMTQTLNPMGIAQYTFWKDWKDHDQMHYDNFDAIFRLCSGCLNMVMEGPFEPIYEIVDHDLPDNITMTEMAEKLGAAFKAGQDMVPVSQPYGMRIIASGEHRVIPGHEKEFEQAAHDTMQLFKKTTPGFLGYMILKQIGASAIGSLQLNPEGLHQALETRGDYPPRNKEGNFATLDAKTTPTEYIVHMEWQDLNTAQLGLARVVVNTQIRKVHDGVLASLIEGPYITFWNPMMEDTSWRLYLHGELEQ
ncbi:MAG: sulfur oxidation protein, partial [Firmicutes bacterium]|nr:sulfur oxidation protein [Bacillota bacterium]